MAPTATTTTNVLGHLCPSCGYCPHCGRRDPIRPIVKPGPVWISRPTVVW